ncbi:E3 ubiquitin-protein ligase TRIM17 [Eumetopias jubatus]|uniref:E3 ubiquitin-protein ligase TRIM17 n=1 Tax=Eumetopias jubatus TaxID=34886 RepID=UPI001015E6C3|nr:E3 ubiquitin-protein ligase TRIM17 [Eumetopias jubatus]
MDALGPARNLQEAATGSICLDYFTDPVMTTCGHDFCRECIRLTWEKAKGRKGGRKWRGSFPCPECRELSPQRNLRPNRGPTKVAEMVRQHPASQSRDLCSVHQELLRLFCEDDQSPICVVCSASWENRPHRVVPIEEAVQEYKLKLEADMGYLREEMMKLGKLQAREKQTLAEWQVKVNEHRQRILLEFEKMGLLLLEKEQCLLQALKQEGEVVARLRESAATLEKQSHALERLLLTLEDRDEHTPLQMLQDMKELLSRKNSLSVQYPEATPTVLRTVCRVPRQIEVLKSFQEDVVPDPATAYPYFLLYESRQKRYLTTPLEGAPHGKDRFLAYPSAVGRETFSSGRHYWEVGMNLTGDALWALGVCRDNVSRRDRVPKSPENVFWVVQLCKEKKYLPVTSAPTPVTLAEPPSHIGVFLDFKAGDVSFYNLKDGSHLHTYTQPELSGPLQTFFCLGALKSGQMVISPVTLWVKG